MTRDQWLVERRTGIGSSESSAVIGANPYMTNVELWEYKTGRKVQEDISHKSYVKYGIDAEHHLRELFKLDFPEYEVEHNPFKLHRNKDYPFIFATLDGELTRRETGEKGVLEIKATQIMQGSQRDKWTDQIPQNYYIQVLHQLIATGWDFVKVKAQLKTDWNSEIRIDTRHYTISKEDVSHDMAFLQGKLVEFWNEYVLKDRRPPLLLPEI